MAKRCAPPLGGVLVLQSDWVVSTQFAAARGFCGFGGRAALADRNTYPGWRSSVPGLKSKIWTQVGTTGPTYKSIESAQIRSLNPSEHSKLESWYTLGWNTTRFSQGRVSGSCVPLWVPQFHTSVHQHKYEMHMTDPASTICLQITGGAACLTARSLFRAGGQEPLLI